MSDSPFGAGMPRFNPRLRTIRDVAYGVDCTDPDPSKWTFFGYADDGGRPDISSDQDAPAVDAPADVQPLLGARASRAASR